MVHLIGGTRNAEFDKIFIGVIDEAAAVKPGTRRTATPVIRFANLPHQFVHRGFLRFLYTHFMHFSYFRDLRAFRLVAFTRDAFFSNEVSGGLRSFTFSGVGSAGRFCFRLAGSGLFRLSRCFFLVVLSGGFFLTFCGFHQMVFLYSRMPRLLRGVCHWRESE
ncbi:Uncharacterised protein [Enterobacter cloacae]|nr:Uncharacterised protein [Enterobacter cloacae]